MYIASAALPQANPAAGRPARVLHPLQDKAPQAHDYDKAEQVKKERAQARLTLAADAAADGGRDAEGMTA
jgi:hypothetical protein